MTIKIPPHQYVGLAIRRVRDGEFQFGTITEILHDDMFRAVMQPRSDTWKSPEPASPMMSRLREVALDATCEHVNLVPIDEVLRSMLGNFEPEEVMVLLSTSAFDEMRAKHMWDKTNSTWVPCIADVDDPAATEQGLFRVLDGPGMVDPFLAIGFVLVDEHGTVKQQYPEVQA